MQVLSARIQLAVIGAVDARLDTLETVHASAVGVSVHPVQRTHASLEWSVVMDLLVLYVVHVHKVSNIVGIPF